LTRVLGYLFFDEKLVKCRKLAAVTKILISDTKFAPFDQRKMAPLAAKSVGAYLS